jgi:hypothetical protein
VKRLAALPSSAGNQHDPAVGADLTRRGATGVEDRVEILRERPAPPLVIHLSDRNFVRWPDASIADEDIQPSELRERFRHECIGASSRREVGGVRGGSHSELAGTLDDGFGVIAPSAVADDDVGATLGEEKRRRRANPARAAGNERPSAGQADHRSRSTRSQMMC